MKNRKDILISMFKDNDNYELAVKLIDEVAKLEDRLTEYSSVLDNTTPTPSTMKKYKFYHELKKDCLNQYMQSIKVLDSLRGKNESGELSPLREYLESMKDE